MNNKTEKEKIGEMAINEIISGTIKQIMKIEEVSKGALFFDNLNVDAVLHDGRAIKFSIKAKAPLDLA